MTEYGYSVVDDAVECALVVASAVDAESSPRQKEDISISVRRGETPRPQRFAYGARAARPRGRAILLASQVLNI